MKKLVLATALTTISSFAIATPYVQGNLAYSKFEAKADNEKVKDSGTAFQITVGNQINNVRYAVDFTQLNKIKETDNTDNSTISLKASSIGLSGFYDFPTATPFTPYVGARVGYNRLNFALTDGETISVKKNRVGYGTIVGISYKVNQQLSADVGIQYNNLGNIKWTDDEGEVKLKTKQTGVNVGLRYQF